MTQSQAIAQYDLKGNLKCVYSRVSLTKSKGFDTGTVHKVLREDRNKHLNHTFRFLTERETNSIVSYKKGREDFGIVTANTLKRNKVTIS